MKVAVLCEFSGIVRDAFFMALYNIGTPKVCVENPFGLPCQQFRRPDQVINPFDFGEAVRKRTCLWLRGLPILTRGDELWAREQKPVDPPEPIYIKVGTDRDRKMYGHHERPRVWHHTEAMLKSKDRAHERSRSFKSIAAAMAEQWG